MIGLLSIWRDTKMTTKTQILSALKIIGVSLLAALVASCKEQPELANQSPVSGSNVSVIDHTGKAVVLTSPAKRIVALAPHLVENVFSAGAGDFLVGVISHSDFPEAAKKLPIVGSHEKANLEQILSIQPDLVLAWESGNSAANINSLRELGITVYVDRTKTLNGIARTVRDIGVLAGTSEIAEAASRNFLEQIEGLRKEYYYARKISTFYQVWNNPLLTINGEHIITATIELCGGTNIYADLEQIAPTINIESVLEKNPEAIIASGMADGRPGWLDEWRQWETLRAVQNNALFFVHPDHIQRHTMRVLKAARTICAQLEQLRQSSPRDNNPTTLELLPELN